ATLSPNYRQRRVDLNPIVTDRYCSGHSRRRIAFSLKVHRKTIERKIAIASKVADQAHERFLKRHTILRSIQLDEMESSEHSKLKPLSIALVVDPSTREILSLKACVMPAKGKLAAKSRAKYGFRADQRSDCLALELQRLKPILAEDLQILSDQCPRYPRAIRKIFPNATHHTTKGRRGCVVGQGELKRGGFDPLFTLNHTAAMVRANMSRMFRRTWNTSKCLRGLQEHLNMYRHYHNSTYLPNLERKTRLSA